MGLIGLVDLVLDGFGLGEEIGDLALHGSVPCLELGFLLLEHGVLGVDGFLEIAALALERAVLVAVGAVQALLTGIETYGVYEYFDRHFHSVGPGVWLTLGGSVVLLAASVIGPRMSRAWR